MTAALPPIPTSLQHLPTLGGLVVPWITARTADGRFLFGAIDCDRMGRALLNRWCGVCGQPLVHRAVLMLRLSDLPRQCTSEPALHPWCADYSSKACPMIAGRVDHYRASAPRLDPTMQSAPDTAARSGSAAEPWFAVWIARYHVIVDHGNLAASYAGIPPLRIRPITAQTRRDDETAHPDRTPGHLRAVASGSDDVGTAVAAYQKATAELLEQTAEQQRLVDEAGGGGFNDADDHRNHDLAAAAGDKLAAAERLLRALGYEPKETES